MLIGNNYIFNLILLLNIIAPSLIVIFKKLRKKFQSLMVLNTFYNYKYMDITLLLIIKSSIYED